MAEQPIGVLVGPAFPRVMRGRKIEPGRDDLLKRGVAMKLGAIVHGDRPHGVRLLLDQATGAVVHLGAGAVA